MTEPSLPPGWNLRTLGDLIRFSYGKALPSRVRTGTGFPVFGSNGVIGSHSEPLTSGPTIIVGRKGSVGEIHLADGPCFPIDTTYYVEDFQDMPIRFCYYLLKHLNLGLLNRSSAIPGLNRTDAYKLPILLPPINEQKQIADKLDVLLAHVDVCRERLKRVPQILQSFRLSVLAAAASGNLTKDWRGSNDIRDWKNCKLIDVIVSKPRNGYSPKSVDFETAVKSLTLSATTSGKFLAEHHKYIDESISEDSYLWLHENDILLQRANTLAYVGVSAIYSGPPKTFIYPDLMMKFRATDEVLPKYLYYALSSEEVRSYFRKNATGTSGNMPKINQAVVCNAPIKLPPIEEQREIVARLDKLIDFEEAVSSKTESCIQFLSSLSTSILSSAFRGDLVSQESMVEAENMALTP